MAEWLYEEGIGETRAALIDDDRIIEAEIELPGGHRAGAIIAGRLVQILVPGRRGIVSLQSGGDAMIEPLPTAITEGAAIRVEITREAIPEMGRPKLPKCRLTDEEERPGPTLLDRIRASGLQVVRPAHSAADRLETAGWSALIEEAGSGDIAFQGGGLRMSVTPAMTLFDVDGALAPPLLAVAGAAAAGRAVRRFAIGGSIGVDLPTLPAKADRQTAAAAFDAVLPMPFERTAVNGFGFLQIVRKRLRPSLPELILDDPAGAAARLLLRRAERAGGSGERIIHAAPAVIARLERTPDWLHAIQRRIGAPVGLRAEPGLAISAGHVQSRFQ